MSGKLIGIARAVELLAPLEEIARANISTESGIEGDARGRNADRQVTVLFRESWEDACRDLGARLPWVTRRANLLIEGIPPPQQAGGEIRIGNVTLEIMFETQPCHLMEKARSGLKAALTPAWRGGVCCNVRSGGTVGIGDAVDVT